MDVGGHVTCCGRRLPTPPTHTFTAVMPGWTYDCGLRADGALTCWGAQPPLPAPVRGPFAALVSYVDVAVSYERGCGLDGGGGLHCWPAEVRRSFEGRFQSVGGGSHICAVTTEGRVVCEDREYY